MKITKGTRAVITGAGSGLGRELALQLAACGAKLWLVDINKDAAERTARECLSGGALEARSGLCDVRERAAIETLAREVDAEWQGADLVVNNAGVAVGGWFEEQSLDDWQWIIETNLWGVIYGCHYFMPLLKKSRGHLLNIASAAGILFPANLASYNVTKAGVVALSETIYGEARYTGVSATVACPTFFMTNLLQTARLARPELREAGDRAFKGSFTTATAVARCCLKAVEKKRLYALPSWDARFGWRVKRIAPVLFNRLLAAMLPTKALR